MNKKQIKNQLKRMAEEYPITMKQTIELFSLLDNILKVEDYCIKMLDGYSYNEILKFVEEDTK
jgi:hypothetical protein